MFDVVAVNLLTGTVRLLAEKKTEKNAEVIVSMAVMRRGVDEVFFTAVFTGTYTEGEHWTGQRIA